MIYCVCICSNKFSKIKIFYVWAENLKIVLSFNVKFVSMNCTDVFMALNKMYTFKRTSKEHIRICFFHVSVLCLNQEHAN